MTGKPDMAVIRYSRDGGKAFCQCRPTAAGWIEEAPVKPWPLYNRARVAKSPVVVLAEGEKCVHCLHGLGIVATTSPGGASNAANADWSPLAGKIVTLWSDNDAAGQKYMDDAAAILQKLQPEVKLLRIDPAGLGLSEKGDVVDYVAAGKSIEDKKLMVELALQDAREVEGPSEGLRVKLEDTISGKWRSIDWPWRALSHFTRALMPGTVTAICGDPGSSKCVAPDTKLLTHDGRIILAKDVTWTTVLMGDDSGPRRVLSLVASADPLYRIVPVKGDPFVVSENHILRFVAKARTKHLGKITYAGWRYYEMNVKDFVARKPGFKQHAKLYRVPLDFPHQDIPLDPYFLGLWLGDGSSHAPHITTMDGEIAAYVGEMGTLHGLTITRQTKSNNKASTYCMVGTKGKKNQLTEILQTLGVLRDKHIPHQYVRNSRNVRLRLLAGLIDTDGCIANGCCQISQKNKRLAHDIVRLAQSLGFAAYIRSYIAKIRSIGYSGRYYHIGISGDLSIVPTRLKHKQAEPRKQKKDVLHTGFTIEPAGFGETISIGVDGNHLHLLGDCTVIHNSFLLLEAMLHWHSAGHKVALYELEEGREYHLHRALALLAACEGLTDDKWVRVHPDETREMYAAHQGTLDALGRCLWDAPDRELSLDDLAKWIESRVADGAEIIGVDPVTAVDSGKEPWIADKRFILHVKNLMAKSGARLILVTHPKKGRKSAVGLDELAGGAAYGRFPQCVLWLESYPAGEEGMISTVGGHTQEPCNRSIFVSKARNGPGSGLRIAYIFDRNSLRLMELGLLLKLAKRKST
ncbi:MAG: hypothetical protein IMZ62_12810 [Chloroflexi bacterium]|nr:hypothetical protein [Chloroflexota bacterium]